MTVSRNSDNRTEKIIALLKAGKPLPDDYRFTLFETKRESELVYQGKEREEDILADTMAVPLQKVKTFRNGKSCDEWANMLIFGDNLQVLKTLHEMKKEGRLKTASGMRGIRLIYIDPPFATKQEFRGAQEEKAYQDKIAGAFFLEFLRKRLVFMKELLSDDGCILVHMDWHTGHYAKVIMDEVFGQENFRNEIYVMRVRKNVQEYEEARRLNTATDTILFYTKKGLGRIKPPTIAANKSEKRRWHGFDAAGLRNGMDYPLFGKKPPVGCHWRWETPRAEKAITNYKEYCRKHTAVPIMEYWKRTGKKLEFLRPDPETGVPEYLVTSDEELVTSLWDDISGYAFNYGFPTEKSEKLMDRIIRMTTEENDLVADFFCGSGTTLAVAEKLGRRWIGVDCGKLGVYTTQKRLLDIAESRDPRSSKRYGKASRPFALYNAGLYDYKMIKELPWERYRSFALGLFQCRDDPHEISNISLDGYLDADSVLVFNYQKHKDAVMTRDFIDDLHQNLEGKIGGRFFIIAPAASVVFLEDYLQKGDTKYFVLRIPYSIIEEIHDKRFTEIRQPISEGEVNDTVDAVGFDFIRPPTVECKYLTEKRTGQLELDRGLSECVIKIEKFESHIMSRKPIHFANRETLSMVMIDYGFDGEVFDLDEVFYAEDLKSEDYEVRFPEEKAKAVLMIIYVDIFGNERRETKRRSDFHRRTD